MTFQRKRFLFFLSMFIELTTSHLIYILLLYTITVEIQLIYPIFNKFFSKFLTSRENADKIVFLRSFF